MPFVDNPSELVMKALAPAKVREVRIHEDTGIAEVIVPDFQLSLAIGKEGQNARLAARLTGWRVDIKSETQLAEEESGEFFAEGEWVEGPDGELMWQPAGGGDAISAADAGYAGATAADLAAAAAAAAEAAGSRRSTARRGSAESAPVDAPTEADAGTSTDGNTLGDRSKREQPSPKAKRMRSDRRGRVIDRTQTAFYANPRGMRPSASSVSRCGCASRLLATGLSASEAPSPEGAPGCADRAASTRRSGRVASSVHCAGGSRATTRSLFVRD